MREFLYHFMASLGCMLAAAWLLTQMLGGDAKVLRGWPIWACLVMGIALAHIINPKERR